jgi:protein-S-isoprenylcysteine O-methyltransferase Ste14
VIPEAVMRRPAAAVVSVAWGVALGGTFGALLPYLLGDWHFHRPLPYWAIAQAAGGPLVCAGLVPVVQSFIEFVRAEGTPVPVASPARLVVSGCYRYVRNPIYVGFMAILIGEALLFGPRGLLEYAAVAWCIGAAGARSYEEPTLARNSGPNTRTTGTRCALGFPGSIHGRQPSPAPPAARTRPKSAERTPAGGGATWPVSKESRPPRPGCT